MKVKIITQVFFVSVLITILVGFGSPDNSWSQPCPETGVTDADSSCGYLSEKLSAGFGIEFGDYGTGKKGTGTFFRLINTDNINKSTG